MTHNLWTFEGKLNVIFACRNFVYLSYASRCSTREMNGWMSGFSIGTIFWRTIGEIHVTLKFKINYKNTHIHQRFMFTNIRSKSVIDLQRCCNSTFHKKVHWNWKLLDKEILMCFEDIWIVHISSHSICIKIMIARCWLVGSNSLL